MGAHLGVREGTGHCCYFCGKPITKDQVQINFRGFNAGAIIHSNPVECNKKKRMYKKEVVK